MIPKPGKNPMDLSSYGPISLLPTISKLLEILTLKKSIKREPPRLDPKTINFDSDRLTPQCNNATA